MSGGLPHETKADAEQLINSAKAHIDAGQLQAAASIYARLLKLSPDNPDLHHTLGLAYFEQRQLDRALYHIGRSIEINPLNAVAYRGMGDALGANGQQALAIRAYEKALTLDPGNTDAMLNLGNIYHQMDLYDQAADRFQKIIGLIPGHIRALNNLGKVYHDLGKLQNALDCYHRCLSIAPEYAEARFNRALLLLAMGDFKQGWVEYAWRFRRSGAASVYPHRLNTPRWRGEDYHGRRLLVHCEQGLGDVLQFARYLPMVKQHGGTLIVEAHPQLIPLLEQQSYVDELVAFDPVCPPHVPHDFHIPLMCLPRLFRTRINSIPNTTPYIQISPDPSNAWRSFFKKDRINIGLVWASSTLNPKRNLPIENCRTWFQSTKHHFLSLQKGEVSALFSLKDSTISTITMMGQHLKNFRDTATVMAELDLVISVDTATAHLAGALGIPLWVMLPGNADWRWPPEVARNPWYPEARIFRQTCIGDWNDLIGQVAAALQDLHPAGHIDGI